MNEHERTRGRRGVMQRKRRLAAEPLCRHCAEKDRVTEGVVVDHIKPLAHGGTDDDSNVQVLCEPCHRTKTARDMGYRDRPTFANDGWPVG